MLSKECVIGLLSDVEKLEDTTGLTKGISCVQHGNVRKRRKGYYKTANSPQQAHRAARQDSARFEKQDLQDSPL
jgi:hypothetical protein